MEELKNKKDEEITKKKKQKLRKKHLKLLKEKLEMHEELNERQKEATKPENLTSDFSTIPALIKLKDKEIRKIEKRLGFGLRK